jgi:hypothetical protein
MASGYGAFGGVGQCYRFWLGYTDCRVRSRARGSFPQRPDSTVRVRIAWRLLFTRAHFPPSSFFAALQLHASHPILCVLEHADYKECLHRDKLKRRIASKVVEHNAAKELQPAAGHGHGAHH